MVGLKEEADVIEKEAGYREYGENKNKKSTLKL